MIWHPARLACRSNTLAGWESPSMLQWYTAVSVTKATVFTDIHFQNMTSSVMVWAFILLFISMLKICSVLAAEGARSGYREKKWDKQAAGEISRDRDSWTYSRAGWCNVKSTWWYFHTMIHLLLFNPVYNNYYYLYWLCALLETVSHFLLKYQFLFRPFYMCTKIFLHKSII